MYYFLGIIMLILFFAANMRYGKHKIQTTKSTLTIEKLALLVMLGIFSLIFTFESVYSNGDMDAYRDSYLSLKELTNETYLDYILDNKDPFFYILSYFFSKLGLGFYMWHALVGFFYSYALYVLLKRYSPNIYISVIVFVALGNLGFALSALRQMLAIAFVMFAFKYIEERKLIKFVVFTLVACLFHSTAMIFLIAYPLYRIKLKVKTLVAMAVAMIMLIPVSRTIIAFILPRIGAHELYYEYLQSDTTLSISGAIISACILMFCVVFLLKNKSTSRYQGLCNFAMVSIFFKILSASFFAEAFRLSLYFSIFDTILIAEACSCGEKNDKTLIKIKTLVATLAIVLYYFVSPNINILNYKLIFLG